jgi:hypothetical protein
MQLIWINSGAASRDIGSKMGTFIFKCPTTGFNVQGFVAEDVPAGRRTTIGCRSSVPYARKYT